MFNKSNCNTSYTKQGGCADTNEALLLKIISNKLNGNLTDILTAIGNFQQTLHDYCDLENEKITQIDNRLASIIDINDECCDIINLKLEELFTVIETIDICVDPCALVGSVECNVVPAQTTINCSLDGSIECDLLIQ